MLRFIMLLLISTTAALAIDFDLRNTRTVTDLLYLPDHKTFFWQPAFLFVDREIKFPASTTNIETTETNFNNRFGYVILENLSLALDLNYLLDGSNKTIITTSSTEVKASGLRDPEFILKWRGLDQKTRGFIIDLLFTFSPSLGNAESGTATKGQNALRGSTKFGPEVNIGKQMKAMAYKVKIGFNTFTQGTTDNLTNSTETKTKSYTDLFLGVEYKYYFNDNIMALIGMSIEAFGVTKERFATGGTTDTNKGTGLSFLLGANYLINSDWNLSLSLAKKKSDNNIKTTTTETNGTFDQFNIQFGATAEF